MTKDARDPAATVRRAWSTVRLSVLQAIVNETIVGLQQLAPSELLGRPLSELEQQLESNPIAAALAACSEELREESGMVDSHERRLLQSRQVRECMLAQPMAWTTAFQEAFQKYRLAAGRTLDAALDVPAGAVAAGVVATAHVPAGHVPASKAPVSKATAAKPAASLGPLTPVPVRSRSLS